MRTFAFARYALNISVVAALLSGCGASQVPAASPASGGALSAFTHHMTFRYTGQKQTFKVPRGVTRIRVIAAGGNGGGTLFACSGRVSAVRTDRVRRQQWQWRRRRFGRSRGR